MKKENNCFVLYNGVKIPEIGFGTWQVNDKEECIESVIAAIKAGYTHIDTAAAYGNEDFISEALKKANVKRDDVFITSKLRAEKKGYEVAKTEFYQTLKRLDTDYLDLYLIHAPIPWGDKSGFDFMPLNIESWKAMIELYNEGKIKAIGVSNFSPAQIEVLIQATGFVPMVNQIYLHVGVPQVENKEYCEKNNILVEAYSPFGTGRIFSNEAVNEIAHKYQVSVARLCVKWCLDYGTLPLPKSVHEKRIKENFDVDFTISDEDYKNLFTI